MWQALEQGPRQADELIRLLGFSMGKMAMITLSLETNGSIRRLPGNRFEIPD